MNGTHLEVAIKFVTKFGRIRPVTTRPTMQWFAVTIGSGCIAAELARFVCLSAAQRPWALAKTTGAEL